MRTFNITNQYHALFKFKLLGTNIFLKVDGDEKWGGPGRS